MRKRPAVLADPASLDMTPIIDIVFNLIVFFMISSELASQDLELLRLPFADQAVRTCRATPERILQVNLPTAGPAMVRGRAYSTVAGDERHAWLLDLL